MRRTGNIIARADDCVDVAESIAGRLKAGNLLRVYVSPAGVVYVRNTGRFYREDLPDAWLVGTFGKATPYSEIEESLQLRCREIFPEEQAA